MAIEEEVVDEVLDTEPITYLEADEAQIDRDAAAPTEAKIEISVAAKPAAAPQKEMAY